MEELTSEVASGIAQKLGIQVAPGESETIAVIMTFISTEALKAGLELVLPSVAAGMSFSPTGISLALIQKQLKLLHEKVDMLLDAPILLAKEKLKEAIIRIETQNFKAAYEDFKTIGTKASEAFNQSLAFRDKIFATKLRLFALLMEASYNKKQEAFLTFTHIEKLRQKEVGMHMQSVVDNLLAVDVKPTLGDKIKLRDKQQSKEKRGKINEILKAVYPFISRGFGWTQDRVINTAFDVISIKIDPAYVPVGKSDAMMVSLGMSWDDGKVVTMNVYCQSKKKDTLVVESSEFSIDRGTEQIMMLHMIITNTGISVFKKWSALEEKLSKLKIGLTLDALKDLRTSAQIKQEDTLLDDYRPLTKRIHFERAHSIDRRSISKNEQERRLQFVYAKDPHSHDDDILIKMIHSFLANDPKNLLKPVDDDNSTILHRLVFNNRGEVVRKLLEDSQFENVLEEALLKRDSNGKSPIALAPTHLQDDNTLNQMIKSVLAIDPKNLLKPVDNENMTILHQLNTNDRWKDLQKLYEDSRLVNVLKDALLRMDDCDDEMLIEIICSFLANDSRNLLQPVDDDNSTILHRLVFNNRGEVIHKLIEDGQFEKVLEEVLLKRDGNGKSPIALAPTHLQDNTVLYELIHCLMENDPKNLMKLMDDKKRTILHQLVLNNRREVIQKLLEDRQFEKVLGEALLLMDYDGKSPIALAPMHLEDSNILYEMIHCLMKNDPKNLLKQIDGRKRTILHQLVLHNRGEVIQKLFEDPQFEKVLGEALLTLDNDGKSSIALAPLHLEDDNILNLMIKSFLAIDPKNLFKPVDNENMTILHQLINNNRHKVLQKLPEGSCLANVLKEALQRMDDYDDDVLVGVINIFVANDQSNLWNPVTENNFTILHQLAVENRGGVIHKLLEDNQFKNVMEEALLKRNNYGCSPLSLASEYLKEDNVLFELIGHFTSNDPRNLLKPVNNVNSTILHKLACDNRGEVIHKLLEDSRFKNVLEEALLKRNNNGLCPLSIATCYLKEDNVLYEMIDHFTTNDLKNLMKPVTNINSTILHELASDNRGEVIYKLLEDSQLRNVLEEAWLRRNNNGLSPLSIANQNIKEDNKLFQLINFLTSNDPKILLKPVNDNNYTILHELARENRGEVIHKLLEDSRLDNVLQEALLKRKENGHSPLSTATLCLKENNVLFELIDYFTSNDPKNLLKPVAEKNLTILHRLAYDNRGEVIHKLLEDRQIKNVLKEALLKRTDDGHSPLSFASEYLKDDNVLIEMIEESKLEKLSKPGGEGPENATLLDILHKHERTAVIQKLRWQ